MKGHKKQAIVCLLLIAGCLSLSVASPQVSKVRFAQRPNSDTVDIRYALSSPDGATSFKVTLEVSTDGGSTFGLVPEAVSGDIGTVVTAGDKHIFWDAKADIGKLQCNNVVVQIRADDGLTGPGPGPAGMKFLRNNSQGYEEYLWLKDSSETVRIPAGSFVMGSGSGDDDEKPMHSVTLSEYYIDKYEVTNRQYRRFCDSIGRGYPDDPKFSGMPDYFITCPDHPVVNVSWNDAKAYCDWAGKRLPTEAEWEKAARGTDGRKYPWGNEEPDATRCNFGINVGHTTEHGAYSNGASPYGCMDMAGNVWEWCNDWYDSGYYSKGVNSNPQGPSSGSSRVFRGGSWISNADRLRCAYRNRDEPAYRNDNLGFRCARSE